VEPECFFWELEPFLVVPSFAVPSAPVSVSSYSELSELFVSLGPEGPESGAESSDAPRLCDREPELAFAGDPDPESEWLDERGSLRTLARSRAIELSAASSPNIPFMIACPIGVWDARATHLLPEYSLTSSSVGTDPLGPAACCSLGTRAGTVSCGTAAAPD
jgi:hypothetical protein